MSKRRSPHKRKTKPRAANPVAKYAHRVCSSGPFQDRKRALQRGYQKHRTNHTEDIAQQLLNRLLCYVFGLPAVLALKQCVRN